MAYTRDGVLRTGNRDGFAVVPLPIRVSSKAIDPYGDLILMAISSDLFALRAGELVPLSLPEGTPREEILEVLDTGGHLWLRVSDGAFRRQGDGWVRELRGRDLFHLTVAADGGWWSGKTVEFARYCREVGADVLMVKPPIWGGSVTVDTLVAHYKEVAAEIPVMLVTNIWAADPAQGLKTIQVLLDGVDGIVAIKDDILGQFVRQMTAMVSDEWAVFAGGQKQNHLDIVHYGAVGYMSTFVTFHPPVTRLYWDAIERSDWTAAAKIITEHDQPLFEYIGGLQGGFDAGMHGLLELTGTAGRWRRKPFYSLNDEEMDGLKAFCQSHGWL